MTTLSCTETYESPNKHPREPSPARYRYFDTNKNRTHFCCMAHEIKFTEDFQSDDETIFHPDIQRFSNDYELVFLKQPPVDYNIFIECNKNQVETYTQCEKMTENLRELANFSVISSDLESRVVQVRSKPTATRHLPVFNIPNLDASRGTVDVKEIKATSVCRHCGKSFDSGQALGGHMSRRHPVPQI